MKTSAKKIVSVLMALLLVIGLAACGGDGGSKPTSTPTPTPTPDSGSGGGTSDAPATSDAPTPEGQISAEPLTLTVFQYELENQQMDFDNLWFYQELEKKTNIHIEWEIAKGEDFKTRYNLMMSSGDLPDIISRGDIGDVNIEEYGVTQGLIIPLDDHLAQYMPNYYERLSMNNANASIPASDGKTYWIGNLTAMNVNHDANHYINKAWLDELNLAVPTTIDQLTDVLKAFRDSKPGGADTVYPFSAGDLIHQTQGLYPHFASFGVPLERYVYGCIDENDKIIFPGYMDGFRAACEWLNMCYNEGLLDKEAITQDTNAVMTKINAGQVGYTTHLRTINAGFDPAVEGNYVSIIPPSSEFGVQVPRILEIPTFGAALTSSNQHIEESLRWLDAQMETETMMVSVNGPINEGAPIEPTLKINDAGKYEVVYIPEDNGLYSVVPVYHGMFFAPGDYYFDIYEMPPHRVERAVTSKDYEDAGVLEKNSHDYLRRIVKMNSDEAIEVSRMFNEIETFMKESITEFITKGVTDAKWQNFLDTAKVIGVDDYVALYQKAYDAYLAANR